MSGEHPVSTNWTNSRGQTYLHMMIEYQHTELVRTLLPKTNPAAADMNGLIPLHQAIIVGNSEIVQLILESSSRVNSHVSIQFCLSLFLSLWLPWIHLTTISPAGGKCRKMSTKCHH